VFVPPPAADPTLQIPPGYNPLLRGPRASTQEPVKAGAERRVRERRGRERRAAGAAPASGPDLAAVLAGAGLEGVSVTPDVARQFGQILRVVVTGVLDVLRARQEVRGEFRIRPTIMQRRRNNPLKHSTDADDALHNLLLKKSPGYLGPVEAFEDAFKDLRNHQLAMLAGVRVAFEAMFSHFDPERLQREFDRHTPKARRGALAALQGKPDYWDFYREWVQRLSQDADGTFRTLFGHEFAKAYEDQLDRLKAQSPASTENGGNGDRVRGR
jgi:type VI secretion system FHA domain protein